jgi:uncharacterized membrane protein YgaE (UPF0421/DUF939 family)
VRDLQRRARGYAAGMALANRTVVGFTEAFVYTSKAALAAAAAYGLSHAIYATGAIWAVVSALVVIQPFLHTSLRASWVRVVANLLAGVVAGALGAFIGVKLIVLVLGIIIVGLACHVMKLDDGLRAAYAGVAIVTLTAQGPFWAEPMQRIVGVFLGCVCALVINLAFDKIGHKFTRQMLRTMSADEQRE